LFAPLTAVAFVATAGVPGWRDLAGLSPDDAFLSAAVQIPAWCGLLFGVCMVLHGELYRLRPPPGRLTTFYLCVAGGGALGGLATGLGAPWLFDDYYELPLGLAFAALLFLAVCAADPASALHYAGRSRWRFAAAACVAIVGLGLTGRTAATGWDGLVHRERSFFGVLRVTEREGKPTGRRSLTSGSTVHGMQLLGERASRVPTAYYGRATAVGLWLAEGSHAPARRVGVVGLGVGTLATYGRAGDRFRFYEIDPAVARIARDEGRFSFLRESRATVEVVLGDGRLVLTDEHRRGDGGPRFDLLVLDAFTSDAIPVHLLTREAFAVYAAALAPDGVLAAHVSNRHFDLMPLIARQGFETGLSSLFVESAHAPAFHSHRAQWVLLVRDADALLRMEAALRRRVRAMGLPPSHLAITRPLPSEVASLPAWTDDYSDLLGLLRPK
jgi:spermidine synthase